MALPLVIKTPATIMLAGPSSCGKSSLVQKIITRLNEVFDRPPERVVICYDRDQELYAEIRRHSPVPVEMVKGLSPNLKPPPRTLLVFDDLQQSSELICDWFTKNSHHYDCDLIYVTQNLFLKSPHHRTCSLNTHILGVFKNPRDKSQIFHLARQVAPDNPKFILSAFAQATSKPHGYLLLNMKQDTPDIFRYRDSFFKDAHFFVDRNTSERCDLSISR